MRRTIRILVLVGLLHVLAPASAQTGTNLWWRSTQGDTLFNFNNSTVVSGGHTLVFDSIPYAKEYTLIIVYHALDTVEMPLWKLTYEGGASRGLTTRSICLDSTVISYSERTEMEPIINTLQQWAPDSTSPYVRLTIGDDAMRGRFKVSEVICIGSRIGFGALRRIQGPLAVRYGVTLGPVDYPDGQGRRFWHNVETYRHHVTGLGHDTTWDVHQTASRSQVDDAVLTLGVDTLQEGDFLVCGDNDQPMRFVDSTGVELLQRVWRVERTGCVESLFSLRFDLDSIDGGHDSVVLILDDRLIRPTSVNGSCAIFSDVPFYEDTSYLTLGRGELLWQLSATVMSHANNNGGNASITLDGMESRVYPNPSRGNYTLEVANAEWVRATIYNALGGIVTTFEDSGKSRYNFSGSLPKGSVYYVTVTTESGSQTTKLVVK